MLDRMSPMEASGGSGSAFQELGPLAVLAEQRPEPDTAALQIVDRPHGLEVAPAEEFDSGDHQDVALGELLVQDLPGVAPEIATSA